MSKYMLERMSDRTSEYMPERMSEYMPKRMSDRMSEYRMHRPERMSDKILYIYIYIYAIYIYTHMLPDAQSENNVRIVCQGGDHSN